MLSDVGAPEVADNGLEVVDLYTDPAFTSRAPRQRDDARHMEGMRRLARTFVEDPDSILQELVDAAVDLCDAESAGISMKELAQDGTVTYHWVATAGTYARFMDAVLPATPSACGLCLERGRPQRFRVTERFFDILQVQAEVAEDGILIPWSVDDSRGTIWIISHTDSRAFDAQDAKTMELLADFAAMAVRQGTQRKLVLQQASAAAAAAMANDLAHHINNPLQGLTNLVYLAAGDPQDANVRALAGQMSEDLARLSRLVQSLLALPLGPRRSAS